MAPVTEAAIVAHGQPGDPGPLQAAVEALAGRVAACLPGGWRVRGATLAAPESLARLGRVRLVYPLFMAEGWFTQSEMPRRLKAAGAAGFDILRPLGLDPRLPAIGLRLAREAAAAAGIDPAAARLVVAGHGHGSPQARGSAEATRAFAAALAAEGAFAAVDCAFLEEPPFLHDWRGDGPAVCLPFFATAASHTTGDVPAAWAEAGAPGPVAEAVGLAGEIPGLIAASLREAAR